MKKLVIVCTVVSLMLTVGGTAGASVVAFDGSGSYADFAALQSAYATFIGTTQDVITFSEFGFGTAVTTEYSASKGVTFSNVGGALGAVMGEGYLAAGGYELQSLDGYNGSYLPDGDKAYARYPNSDTALPYTITFSTPKAVVGSFIGMGKEGTIDTLTLKAYDALDGLLATLMVKTGAWADPDNREGFWGIQSSVADIAKITISNDSTVAYGDALIIDTIEWSTVPEPATMALLGLGGLLLRRKK